MLIEAAWLPNLALRFEPDWLDCSIHPAEGERLLAASCQHLFNSGDHLSARDRVHATKIERAFPQETGTAFDVMPKNPMPLTQWPRALRFSRTENRNRRN